MKRLIACVSLAAAAATAAVSSAAAPPQHPAHPSKPAPKKVVARAPKCRVAPADEYFGKLKMSILGIRNTIKDQGLKVDYYPDKADSTLNAMSLAEDALHDWQHKYPCDSWLPGSIYALEHFYTKIHTADGVKHVHATYAWLRHDFPRDRVVVVARSEDGAAVVQTAAPVAVSSAAGSAADAAAGAAASTPTRRRPARRPPSRASSRPSRRPRRSRAPPRPA